MPGATASQNLDELDRVVGEVRDRDLRDRLARIAGELRESMDADGIFEIVAPKVRRYGVM